MKKRCMLCPKEYQSEKDLNNHYKKIHGGIPFPVNPLTIGDVKAKGR